MKTYSTSLQDVQNEVHRQIVRDWSTWTNERKQAVSVVGLTEEAGEVAGLFKRQLRHLPKDLVRCTPEHFVEELGDVLWYLVAVCDVYGIPLEGLWEYNMKKLEDRYGL